MHHHYILHKPYGFLSQFITHAQRQKKKHRFLGELYNFAEGTMSIGRLDRASEGLLLLTTDGKVSHEITGKKYEKEYYAQLDGVITDEALEQLRKGVDITVDGHAYTTLPGLAKRIDPPGFEARQPPVRDDRHGPTSWISIIIREGKFRQVRKMTAAVGFPTLRLVRVRVAGVWLGDLRRGEVREVQQFDGVTEVQE
ncbi:MAG: pseudouridine synthase [Crocinitomicaceae bacterium]